MIDEWRQAAHAAYPEREEAIRALLIGAVAGLDVLFEGPPGTGKTSLFKAFAKASGASLFSTALSAWTDDASLVGPVDLEALKQGQLARKGAGYLADCDLAFLDELPRAGRGIRDLVLSALAERRLPDGTPVRARMIGAAANSALTDEEDLALADRFALVVRVDKVQDTDKRRHLLLGGGNPTLPAVQLPTGWESVQVPDEISDVLAEISAEHGSVRRWIAAVKACRAHALLDGRGEVGWDDLRAVLPLAIPGPGDSGGKRRALIENAMDEHAPAGDQALVDFKALCARLVGLGERKPSSLSADEAAEWTKRWETMREAGDAIKADHPHHASEVTKTLEDYGRADSQIMMNQLRSRVGGNGSQGGAEGGAS